MELVGKSDALLIIDDDVNVRSSICMYFEDLGYEVFEAENGVEGLRLFHEYEPAMVFCDLRMPVMDGLEVLAKLTSASPQTPVAMISGAGRIQDVVEALRRGAWNYITKPIENMEVLRHVAEQAIEKMKLQQENQKYHQYLEDEVIRRTKQLAQSTAHARVLAEEAKAANRAKGEFLANMSHEFRTPLNSIMVLSRVLAENREQSLIENQIEMLEQISSSGHELLGLVNEVLEVAHMESSELHLDMKVISVQKFVHRIDRIIAPLAWQKGLAYTIEFDENAPETFYSDILKATRIVRNIVSNAVKFTPVGSITIRVGRPPSDMSLGSLPYHSEDALMVQIEDTGIGIESEQQKHIFSLFMQADGADTRNFQGSGLGLTISSRFAVALGGDIFIESEVGKGSVFSVIFPVQPNVDSAEVGAVSTSPGMPYNLSATDVVSETHIILGGERVLIVDDDMRLVFNMSAMLETLGAEVLISTETATTLQRLKNERQVDLLICRAQMLSEQECAMLSAMGKSAPPVIFILEDEFDSIADKVCGSQFYTVTHPPVYDKIVPIIKSIFW